MSEQEISEAMRLIDNRTLKDADWTYLKEYEIAFPGLYKLAIQTRDKYRHVLAKTQLDRKPLKIAPVSLGLKSEVFEQELVIHQKQYPLNETKRLAMTGITIVKDKNGFYEEPAQTNPHNIPYSLLNKNKSKPNGAQKPRWREFFDLRKLNNHTITWDVNMQTVAAVKQWLQFTDWEFAILIDFKNYYELFEIVTRDRPFTRHETPLGPRQHTALTYGHANAPAIAQKFSNKIAAELRNAVAWLDDILKLIKRGECHTTQELIPGVSN